MALRDFDDDSTLECGHCGEIFFYELTRCPNCGQEVYPEEDDPPRDTPASKAGGGWGDFAGYNGVLQGWAIAVFTGSVLFFGLRPFLGEAGSPRAGFVPLWAGVLAGSLLGSYLGVALNKEQPRRTGVIIGGLNILGAIALASAGGLAADGGLWTTGNFVLWDLSVFCGLIAGEFWRRQQRESVLRQLFPDLPGEAELYARLLAATGQDKAQAERLIEFERQYMENATRRTLIEAALQRRSAG